MDKLKSNDEYLREAREDIEKEIKEIENFNRAQKAAVTELEANKQKVKSMNDQQLGEWLVEKHEEFVSTLDAMFKCNSMDPQDFDDRCLKILYINELNTLLYLHEIEDITEKMVDVMKEKNCVDLLVVLHVLGFI